MPSSKVKPVPEGYHSMTPYLIVKGAGDAIEFYKRAFGAEERFRMQEPNGRVTHAEMQIGDSHFMLADEVPEMGYVGPETLKGSPISLLVYVEDVDSVVSQAVAAGGKLTRPVTDQFYGDRSGGVQDPFGHQWHIATHVEDVSAEEMQRRAAAQHGH